MADRRRRIGSANRRGGCGTLLLVISGIIMLPAGAYLIWDAETQLTDYGADFARIEMMQPEAARSVEGELVKVQGQPEGEFLVIDEWEGEALYHHKLVEGYKQDTSGHDEGPSYRWQTLSSNLEWVASFTIDGIEIQPAEAHPVGREVVHSVYRKTGERVFSPVTERVSPSVGDDRINIEILDAAKPVVVLGEISGGVIAGGTRFVVSTQNEEQTLQTLKSEYGREKWRNRGYAAVFLFMGLACILIGLQLALGKLPVVGDQFSWGTTGLVLVVTMVWVLVAGLSMGLFWIVGGILLLTLVVFAYRGATTPREEVPVVATEEAPCREGPPTSPAAEDAGDAAGLSCANCGAALDAEDKFCAGCGSRVE